MNPNVALEIVELAVSLAKTPADVKLQQDATVASILVSDHRESRPGEA